MYALMLEDMFMASKGSPEKLDDSSEYSSDDRSEMACKRRIDEYCLPLIYIGFNVNYRAVL